METHIIFDSVWIKTEKLRIDLFKFIEDNFPEVNFDEGINFLLFTYECKSLTTPNKESIVLYIGYTKFELFNFIRKNFSTLKVDEIFIEYNISKRNNLLTNSLDNEKIANLCLEAREREQREREHRESENKEKERKKMEQTKIKRKESMERNKGKVEKSKYKCVYLKNNSWQSFIRINNKLHYIGSFKMQEEAAKAYNRYATERGIIKRSIKI